MVAAVSAAFLEARAEDALEEAEAAEVDAEVAEEAAELAEAAADAALPPAAWMAEMLSATD